ncbi:nicotinate phosphoribosyltransferase [Halosquirtibacter laminarini]|uniref:Nicotinate phosphoribosyltransferase n=1 Tax=Halosquirtibacter laminarini TaxID=3374600 RepID=A0AC61NCT8_9BACT|nr:nicotinate phosphoribosyltransferase [Prolixibacteraceae bacterium]
MNNCGLYTDFYEITMSQAFFLSGKGNSQVSFDYFYRTNPFGGGYLIFAGLSDAIELVKRFNFSEEDIAFLAEKGIDSRFLDYLRDFKFQGDIYSMKEGEIAFPRVPIMRIEGNIIECQLIETLLLNILNYESLIATKTFRITQAARGRNIIDFGIRRAHGTGAVQASKAAIIGGAVATSNVYAAKRYNLEVSGTMAHSWVQSFQDEYEAFKVFSDIHPDNCILLVDTYNTLRSGLPNAIKLANELKAQGRKIKGIRLDSGDLSYLSRKARKMLDDAGHQDIIITASNQLNEHVIKSLLEQDARIDAFGVGTEMITGKPDSSLDGVYKLAECDGISRMKVSENIEKVTLPGAKKVVRYYDHDGMFYRDAIVKRSEKVEDIKEIFHPSVDYKKTTVEALQSEELQKHVMSKGEILIDLPSAKESHEYLMERSKQLPSEHYRFISPHIYKVGLSLKLKQERDNFLNNL